MAVKAEYKAGLERLKEHFEKRLSELRACENYRNGCEPEDFVYLLRQEAEYMRHLDVVVGLLND